MERESEIVERCRYLKMVGSECILLDFKSAFIQRRHFVELPLENTIIASKLTEIST